MKEVNNVEKKRFSKKEKKIASKYFEKTKNKLSFKEARGI